MKQNKDRAEVTEDELWRDGVPGGKGASCRTRHRLSCLRGKTVALHLLWSLFLWRGELCAGGHVIARVSL